MAIGVIIKMVVLICSRRQSQNNRWEEMADAKVSLNYDSYN